MDQDNTRIGFERSIGIICLILGALLIAIEWIVTSAKMPAEKAHPALEQEGYALYGFIHNVMGYKFIFPLLGLGLIAVFAFMVFPLITKEEERP